MPESPTGAARRRARVRLSFTVEGTPIPQGSPKLGRHGARPVILLDSKKLRAWRRLVSFVAQNAAQRAEVPVYDEPVVVLATFYFERPKRPRWDVKATRPDLDKLQRAIGDSLEAAKIVTDDSRIVGWPACPAKLYGAPRVEVEVVPLGEYKLNERTRLEER
jgi:Holliday junction resolvase RusA-like endonuclease